MRNRKRTNLLILFTLAVVVLTAAATLNRASQEQPPTPEGRRAEQGRRERLEFEKQFPAVEFDKPEPADPEERAKRKKKNKRYDNGGFAIRDPDPSIGEQSGQYDWELYTEALPAGQSNVVVVSEVLTAEAYLSTTKDGIYTEFTVRVGEVLKNVGSNPLKPGSCITIDRLGGIVRYPEGHKRLHRVVGQNMPRVGGRYVFFLDAPDESPNYQIVTGYELVSGRVSALDESSRMRAYSWMEEAKFLRAVRDAIAQAATATN